MTPSPAVTDLLRAATAELLRHQVDQDAEIKNLNKVVANRTRRKLSVHPIPSERDRPAGEGRV